MLSFILKIRLKQIFIDSSNGIALGIRYLMMIFSFVYGVLYGYLIDKVNQKNPLEQASIEKLYTLMILAFVISFVIKNYFPAYKGSTRFIHVAYPVNAAKRALAHLINDSISSLIIGFGFFFSVMFLMAEPLKWNAVPSMLFFSISFILVERNFRRSLDFNLKYSVLHWLLVGILLGGLILILSLHFNAKLEFYSLQNTIAYGLLLLVSFFHTIWIDNSVIDARERFQFQELNKEFKSILMYWLQISWRQNKTRVTMLVAVGSKLFLMIVAMLIGEKQNVMSMYQYLVFSPIMVGTQIFANSFGFYRQFWLMDKLYSSNRSDFDHSLVMFMLSIIGVDFLISSILMVIGYKLTLSLLFYYLLCIPVTIQTALLSSYKYPFYVEKAITTANSNSTSPLIGLLVMGVMILFGVLTHFHLLVWFSPIILFLNYKYHISWQSKRDKLSPLVYDKLFKG